MVCVTLKIFEKWCCDTEKGGREVISNNKQQWKGWASSNTILYLAFFNVRFPVMPWVLTTYIARLSQFGHVLGGSPGANIEPDSNFVKTRK